MQLEGKTALISGAGRNNGKAIAETFAKEGAQLILVAREMGEQLNQVVKECERQGAQVVSMLADMTNPEQVQSVVSKGLARFGKIDVAVSVLGMRVHKPITDFTYEEWLQGFAINCHSLFLLAKYVVPGMKQHGAGSIIAFGGQMTIKTSKQSGLVVASKHGILGLVKNLALELGPFGIRVNLLNPGRIQNIRKHPEWYPDGKGEYSQAEIERIPLRRIGRNQEIANVALFLASEQSSYVTGDGIYCTGGQHVV